MQTIDIPMAPQRIAKSFLEGKEAAQEFGFPLCIRASFTLGGSGATIVYEKEDFEKALEDDPDSLDGGVDVNKRIFANNRINFKEGTDINRFFTTLLVMNKNF